MPMDERPFYPRSAEQDVKTDEEYYYRDNGCELSPSCRDCPLPRCAYEEPGGIQQVKMNLRNSHIVDLATQGKEVKEIAALYQVSVRSIQRILQPYRKKNGRKAGKGGRNV